MPLASLPRWSRPGADAERLNRLRARAVARMQVDERAAGVSWAPEAMASRRGVLRRFGILLAGVVPGVAALVKAQAAMAKSPIGSVRSCAPQYGAPSWPAERTPYVPVPAVSNSRSELASVTKWRLASALVVPVNKKTDAHGFLWSQAKTAFYADGWGGGTHALLAVGDPDADVAYIMRGGQTFYAVIHDDMFAFLLGPGVVSVHGSLFKRKGDKEGLAAVIADFALISDQAAYQKDSAGTNINLEKGIPQSFWVRNTERGWENTYTSVAQVRRQGDALEMTVLSAEFHSPAVFTVDVQAKALVKTKFDGKEWAA